METIFDHCTDKNILEEFTNFKSKEEYLLKTKKDDVYADLWSYFYGIGNKKTAYSYLSLASKEKQDECRSLIVA